MCLEVEEMTSRASLQLLHYGEEENYCATFQRKLSLVCRQFNAVRKKKKDQE